MIDLTPTARAPGSPTSQPEYSRVALNEEQRENRLEDDKVDMKYRQPPQAPPVTSDGHAGPGRMLDVVA